MQSLLLLAVTAVFIAAIPPKKPAWTFKFRSEWNHGCFVTIDRDSREQGRSPDPIKIMNFCDCASDGLQDAYTEAEMTKLEDKPTDEFKSTTTKILMACLKGPT